VGVIARGYNALVNGLAVLAGVVIVAITLMIVVDVLMRNFGLKPPAHTIALTEYSLLYITMLGAPWLVREKGHVHIELIVSRLAPLPRRIVHAVVCLLCVVVCAVLFWYSLQVTLLNLSRGDIEIRSFDVLRGVLIGCMPVGFVLMTIEFLRFLVGRDSMFTGASVYE
jgi:TRAP-type C4-dicarboxylate transport system permease small subunit